MGIDAVVSTSAGFWETGRINGDEWLHVICKEKVTFSSLHGDCRNRKGFSASVFTLSVCMTSFFRQIRICCLSRRCVVAVVVEVKCLNLKAISNGWWWGGWGSWRICGV